jgi:hypothetical protein
MTGKPSPWWERMHPSPAASHSKDHAKSVNKMPPYTGEDYRCGHHQKARRLTSCLESRRL